MKKEVSVIIFMLIFSVCFTVVDLFTGITENTGEAKEGPSVVLWEKTTLEESEAPSLSQESTEEYIEETEEDPISEEDLELLAHLVYAEAGNQSEEGKRLVIDVVLNRVESDLFPNTIYDVIYQKNPRQFSVTYKEKLWKKEPTEDIYDLILEECRERVNTEILYFSAGECANGKFWKKVGDHYFATQKGVK